MQMRNKLQMYFHTAYSFLNTNSITSGILSTFHVDPILLCKYMYGVKKKSRERERGSVGQMEVPKYYCLGNIF